MDCKTPIHRFESGRRLFLNFALVTGESGDCGKPRFRLLKACRTKREIPKAPGFLFSSLTSLLEIGELARPRLCLKMA